MDGLVKAIEEEVYCPTLLEQSLSIQRSLKSLDCFLLENHLRTHVKHQMQHKGSDEKAVKEAEWFDDEVISTKHTDFFFKRSINYSKRQTSITAQDIF